MPRTLVTASVVTVFLLAGLVPMVLAHDPEPSEKSAKKDKESKQKLDKEEKEAQKAERKELKEERKREAEERKELEKQRKEQQKEERREYREVKYLRGNASLTLSGTAVGKDNATYRFNLTASGQGIERVKVYREGDRVRYQARLVAHVVLTDANGTVVEESDLRVRLYARGHDGNIKWTLGSVEKREDGAPRLLLKGEADKVSLGVFELEGKGKAVFKLADDERATPLKLRAVSGTFTREVPAPPPAPVAEQAEATA